MKIKLGNKDLKNPQVMHAERVSGEDLKKCYQCGNCSGGCPVSYAMDVTPSQAIRFMQLGRIDEVLEANSMWVCVGCLQCYSRCPKAVSAANLFEALRQMTLRSGEDNQDVGELPAEFLKNAPQQAIVCGFRKLVS